MRSYTNLRGAFRATGASLPFLSRRAHLLTTHKMGGGIPFRVVHSARLCGSSGALCTMTHFFQIAVIVHAVSTSTTADAFVSRGTICTLPCANCLRKPATGSFIADMGSNAAHFLFAKRNRNQGVAFYHPLTKYESR